MSQTSPDDADLSRLAMRLTSQWLHLRVLFATRWIPVVILPVSSNTIENVCIAVHFMNIKYIIAIYCIEIFTNYILILHFMSTTLFLPNLLASFTEEQKAYVVRVSLNRWGSEIARIWLRSRAKGTSTIWRVPNWDLKRRFRVSELIHGAIH